MVPPAEITRSAYATRLCASIARSGTMKRAAGEHLLALLGRARQHHRLSGAVGQAVEHPGEQRVLEAVVQRHVRRRAHDHERPVPVDRELPQHGLVGLEVGQVVLLLQARRSAAASRAPRSGTGARAGWRRAPRRRAPAGSSRCAGPPRTRSRRPWRSGCAAGAAATVTSFEPWPIATSKRAPARPAREREAARGEPDGLAAAAAAAVMADRRVLDPEALAELERLGEVARGHLHLVPVLAHRLDQRPQHQDVRAVGQIDPDTHRSASYPTSLACR